MGEVEVTVPQVAMGSNPLVCIQEKYILIKPVSGAHHGAHHVHTIHHARDGLWCDGVRQPSGIVVRLERERLCVSGSN